MKSLLQLALGKNEISRENVGTTSGRSTIYLIVFALISFFIWASRAPLDEIVRGSGKVVPTTSTQILQNLEGGIVKTIHISEGDTVDAGEVIAQLDQTQFKSIFDQLETQRELLELKLMLLQAENNLEEVGEFLTERSSRNSLLMQSEIQLYSARKKELEATLKSLERTLTLKSREADILRPMVKEKAVPEIDILRLEQEIADIEGKISSTLADFETRRAQEYSEALSQLREVQQQINVRRDQLDRTEVKTPVKGIVNKVLSTTIGGVVAPGEALVEILPLGDDLHIEGRVDPRDIGFVYVGMPARVKLTAFDYSIYGVLAGKVVTVGADTIRDEENQNLPPYYEILVSVETTTLAGPSGEVVIRPGMQAEVELQSGRKTVLEYLVKPLFKATTAFTER